MNRTLVQTAASFLVFAVSGITAPRLIAQQSSTGNITTSSPAAQPTSPSPQPAPSTTAQQAPSNTLPPIELPENPGRSSTSQTTAPAPKPQQQPPPQPDGTAVAPPIEVSGGAASKPAGVAIAPPKQRQTRSLLIKLGLLAGAGVAIGTVVGLSAASPGHVPNSPGH